MWFHKCLIFSIHVTQSCNDTNIWYSLFMKHSHAKSCHKCLIISTHVTQSCHFTNDFIQYSCHTVMSCNKCLIFSTFSQCSHVKNVWYSELISHCHAMTYHKRLIFSTHVTQTCHVLWKMSVIQYSCHKFIHVTKVCYSVLMLHSRAMSCHKCLIFSNYITQSCHVTNFWYSLVIS